MNLMALMDTTLLSEWISAVILSRSSMLRAQSSLVRVSSSGALMRVSGADVALCYVQEFEPLGEQHGARGYDLLDHVDALIGRQIPQCLQCLNEVWIESQRKNYFDK